MGIIGDIYNSLRKQPDKGKSEAHPSTAYEKEVDLGNALPKELKEYLGNDAGNAYLEAREILRPIWENNRQLLEGKDLNKLVEKAGSAAQKLNEYAKEAKSTQSEREDQISLASNLVHEGYIGLVKLACEANIPDAPKDQYGLAKPVSLAVERKFRDSVEAYQSLKSKK